MIYFVPPGMVHTKTPSDIIISEGVLSMLQNCAIRDSSFGKIKVYKLLDLFEVHLDLQ